MAPAQNRKRQRKRRRHTSLDLSSSSSEGDSEHEVQQEQKQTPTQKGKDSDSDDSSAVFSSSDEELAESLKGKGKGKGRRKSTAIDEGEPKATNEEALDLVQEPEQIPERAPTPPYLFWDKLLDEDPQEILQGEKIQMDAHPAYSSTNDIRFRDYYMKELITNFSDELEALRLDNPDFTTTSLSDLVKCLAEGANTFDKESKDVSLSMIHDSESIASP